MCGPAGLRPARATCRVSPLTLDLLRVRRGDLWGCRSDRGRISPGETARLVPWTFAVVLIVLGLGLEKRLPQPRFAASLLFRARLNRSLGWLTPLLPCGPLWLMLGAAAITGSLVAWRPAYGQLCCRDDSASAASSHAGPRACNHFPLARRVGCSKFSPSAPPACSSGAPRYHFMQTATEQHVCIHCGTLFRPRRRTAGFLLRWLPVCPRIDYSEWAGAILRFAGR